MKARHTLEVIGLTIAVAGIGLALWALAAVGAAQWAEDSCLHDVVGRSRITGYRTHLDLWPPSYECRLNGPGGELFTVQHRSTAIAIVGAWIGFPVVYSLVSIAGIWWFATNVRGVTRRPADGA